MQNKLIASHAANDRRPSLVPALPVGAEKTAEATPGPISKEHRALSKLAKSVDARTVWLPMREEKAIYRRSYTNQHSGNTYCARDYGHRAFPVTQRGPHVNLAWDRSRRLAKQQKPIESSYRLTGGFAPGDRIRHAKWGGGVILSVSPEDTIFAFDLIGLLSVDSAVAHLDLLKT